MNEWTEGRVFAYMESEDYTGLAEAINAALAAEREDYRKQALSNHTAQEAARSTIKHLEQQIAAERDKVETLVRELRHCANRIAGGYRSQSTMLTDDQLVTRADTVLAKVGKQ